MNIDIEKHMVKRVGESMTL